MKKDEALIRTFTDLNPHVTMGSIGFFERGYGWGNYFIFDNVELLFENDYAGPKGTCASTCFNGLKDGDETDVDCGSSCPSCVVSILGDVNGDEHINMLDATLIARSLVGLETLNAEQANRADVNGDGKTTIMDAVLIAKKFFGLINQFPAKTQ